MVSRPLPGIYVIIALVLVFGPACRDVSQPALDGPAGTALFPVEQNGEWGYISRDGNVVIEPQYDRAYPFYENRALVRQGGQFGFIDTSGSPVIPIGFSRAWHFSEGIAPVQQDSLWGFVDRTGDMILEPQLAAVSGLSNLQSSPSPDTRPADSVEHPSLAPSFSPVPYYFSEGRARIRTGDGWGYVDRKGSSAVEPRFQSATGFRDGLARVTFTNDEMGYINTEGSVVWPPDG